MYSETIVRQMFFKRYWPFLIPLGLVFLFPWAGKNYFILRIGIITVLYAINAVGMTLLVRYAGLISLGHSAFFASGAYISAILMLRFGLNGWLSMIISVSTTVLFAYLFSVPFLKLRKVYLAMATLALGEVVYLVIKELPNITGGMNGLTNIPYLDMGFVQLKDDWQIFYLTGFVAIVIIFFSENLSQSRLGRALHAVRTDEMAAEAVGIDAKNELCRIFCFSAGLSALSGCLLAHFLTVISPDSFTLGFSVSLLIFVVIGGANIWAGVVTSVLLVAASEVFRTFQDFSLGPYGLILIISLFVFPDGLAEIFRRRHAKTHRGTNNQQRPAKETVLVRSVHLERDTTVENHKESILELKQVSKAFGGNKALSNLSLSVPYDAILGIIGPNGAGKTTTLNVINGFFPADAGSIKFRNIDVFNSSPHEMAALGVGRTFQMNNLFQGMTVIENVMVGAHLIGKCGMVALGLNSRRARLDENVIFGRAMESLEFLDLAHRAYDTVDELSYGEQRLVELSRALSIQPKLLLLDEIAAGLTAHEVEMLPQLLRLLRNRGITIILVEHNMPLVMGVSDYVLVLEFGQQLAFGMPSEISKDERVIMAYLGEATKDA